MRGRGSQRRTRRESRLRSIGVPPHPAAAAALFRNVGDALGGAITEAKDALQERLRRRGEGKTDTDASEEVPAAG